jgi:mannose-6-phosphate isomerase
MCNRTTTRHVELVDRPWGWYEVFAESTGSKVKRIHVHPGQKISLQKHRDRKEHWVVVLGTARVTIGKLVFDMPVGGHCEIEPNEVHRLENLTAQPLEIIEVQIGHYLGEDDIVRIDDAYGRHS